MKKKLQHAAIIFLGNGVAISRLATSVRFHGEKSITSPNKLLVDKSFKRLSKDHMHRWKWTRMLDATNDARDIETNFLSMVKVMQKLGLLTTEELKRKRAGKTLTIQDDCKPHAGPPIPDSLGLINEITEKELLAKIKVLRCTTTPDIRQMRRHTKCRNSLPWN